jgi:hypothetical protein
VQKWLDLLTPSAAALSLLLVIALVIQAIRQGRAVRRLESRLAEREGAAARVSLDRLEQLQRRASTSTEAAAAPTGDGGRRRVIIAAVVALALVATIGWFVFGRDGGSSDATAKTPTTTRTTSTPTKTPPQPIDTSNTVPENPATLPQDKGAYTVLVLNGTTVPRAAGTVFVPAVQRFGYNTAPAGDATSKDVKKSFVMFLPGREDVADNVAHDLGIKTKLPLDGVAVPQDTSGVDAIVVLGTDLATGRTP